MQLWGVQWQGRRGKGKGPKLPSTRTIRTSYNRASIQDSLIHVPDFTGIVRVYQQGKERRARQVKSSCSSIIWTSSSSSSRVAPDFSAVLWCLVSVRGRRGKTTVPKLLPLQLWQPPPPPSLPSLHETRFQSNTRTGICCNSEKSGTKIREYQARILNLTPLEPSESIKTFPFYTWGNF